MKKNIRLDTKGQTYVKGTGLSAFGCGSHVACVDACPTDALRFGEAEDLKQHLDGAEILHPEYNTQPRVYYKGLPNRYFIAGAVYGPDTKTREVNQIWNSPHALTMSI